MDDIAAADFYTGIVVDVYGPLRGSVPDAAVYARFIDKWGEPALELGCGDGDPLLTLRTDGIDVEGLDSSADMLAKLRTNAAQAGIEVTVHHSTIGEMDLGTTYRSIFLAGPTFNLLPDDTAAFQALKRIYNHLDPGGAALIPLFIPEPVPAAQLGLVREHIEPSGRILRVTATATERDDPARRQVTTLRYEVIHGGESQVLERPWLLHWYHQAEFRELAVAARLRVEGVESSHGSPAEPDATAFSFVLRRDDG